jgi:hypothetical protein
MSIITKITPKNKIKFKFSKLLVRGNAVKRLIIVKFKVPNAEYTKKEPNR